MTALVTLLWIALWVFAAIGVFVFGFAIVCVRDSQRMKRGTK